MPEVHVADGDDWVSPAGSRSPRGATFDGPRILLDSDFAPDVDDAVALAQLHGHTNLGETEMLGTVLTASCDYSAGAMDAFNIWHGRSSISVGAIQVGGLPDTADPCDVWLGDYATPVYNNYPRNLGLRSTVDDVVDTYRTILAAAPDGSVDIVTIGFLNGVELLLKSAGDAIDDRDGVTLVADKVRRLTTMGGSTTHNHQSWNFHGNNTQAVTDAWLYCETNWPSQVPWHFCPSDGENHSWGSSQWDGGNGIGVGVDAPNQPVDHILRRAMNEFGETDDGNGIHLADPATVYYVARPDEFAVRRGTMSSTDTNGRTTWSDDESGPHWCVDGYTANGGGTQALADAIEPLLWHEEAA